MADFPALIPSSRNFSPGDFPVKSFRAQSGAETRIRYGSKRTGMRLTLTYKNISDVNAAALILHYQNDGEGTYKSFDVGKATLAGFYGATTTTDPGSNIMNIDKVGNKWRYAGPPKMTNVRPGISNVQVNLVGVL